MDLSTSTSKPQYKIHFRVPNNLKVVCQAIVENCAITGRHQSNSKFICLLETLSYLERSFIANYFCQLPWNVSSVRVLGCLNRLRILTSTEYILSQTDDEHVQLVLNDFLETEFDLVANLIICGQFDLMNGSKITEYIDESIRRLFADLARDSKLNNLDYLEALKSCVPKEQHTKFVFNHLNIILSMHKSSTKVAFANFSDWTKENPDTYEVVSNFYKKAVAQNDLDIVKTLLNISTSVHFIGWRNYLLLLGLIAKNGPTQCYSFIKKWLKDRLKIVAETGSTEIMAHLLISIRVVLLFQEDKTDTYAKWYKQNIGDMKFVFNATEFKTMMGVLTDLVPFENDEEYLEVHVKTLISAPIMCSQLCRDYKTLCQTRMFDVTDCTKFMELDDDLFYEI